MKSFGVQCFGRDSQDVQNGTEDSKTALIGMFTELS